MSDRDKPCAYEVQILRECAGELEPSPWGAAVGVALEYLRGHGYMEGNAITEKGRSLLSRAKLDSESEGT